MDLRIDRDGERAIFLQIADGLERLAGDGGEIRLPPSRELAARLGVNRNTVVNAYQELIARGRATAHTGRGTFLRPSTPEEPRPGPWSGLEPVLADSRELLGAGEAEFSFARNFPPQELLPAEAFRDVLDELLRRDGASLLTYGSPTGYWPLREWIAAEMGRRGIAVAADELIITTGSQQAIDLAARALVAPGDRVLLEDPGFPLAIGAFRSHGAIVEGIPVDGEGVQVDRLERALEAGPARLLYLVPEFHNPTGVCLAAARRREVLELARRHGVPVVEDDSGGWLRFRGEPSPSLRALDRDDLTLYVSTFSKMLVPGLRVGWMFAPAPIRDRILGLKQLTDCATSLLLQAAVHEFCRDGGLDRHLAVVRPAYRERRDALVAAMRERFPAEISWTEPDGGLALWVTLPSFLDARDVLAEARGRGVVFTPGEPFSVEGTRRNHLRLTFAGLSPAGIRKGARILGEVLHAGCDRLAVDRAAAAPLV